MHAKVGNYIITELISQCHDGKVYKAINPSIPKTSYAIRVVPNELISPNKLLALEREVTILRTIMHKNIIALKTTSITNKNYCLVFEYCDGGNLASFIKNYQFEKISETVLRDIIRQIVSGVEALHSNSVAHNNLTPNNILLAKEGEILRVKLSDFRSAQFVHPKSHDFRYDIFDIGHILQKLINKDLEIEASFITKRLDLSKECLDFLKGCFQVTNNKELFLKTIKAHPFISMDEGEMGEKNMLEESCDWLLVRGEESENMEEEFEMISSLDLEKTGEFGMKS